MLSDRNSAWHAPDTLIKLNMLALLSPHPSTMNLIHPLRLLIVCALLGALPLRAADKFTPHHVAKVRAVSSVAISPDGTEVAYLLSVPRKPMVDDDGTAFVELHVVNARGEYLLAQRPRGKAHEGLWEFPGGKIQAGEDAATALAREIKEELDLELLACEPHGVYSHIYEKEQISL